MKQLYLFFLLLTTLSFSQGSYYDGIDFSQNGIELKDDLAVLTIAKHTTFLRYTDRHDYLYNADEDLSNTLNVVLIYSGESRYELEYESSSNAYQPQTFNTEHVYPRSLVNSTAEGDLHHLRVCDIDINTARGNSPFADKTGGGTYGSVSGGWYPGDDWRGDVARMIMYMNLRYNEPFDEVGNLDLFLRWNVVDPVSAFENQRNDVIESAQGNRNPFIDNPYLATKIWGGDPAEDTWGTLGNEELFASNFNIYPNPVTNNTVYIQSGNENITNISLFNAFGQQVLERKNTPNNSKTVILDNLPSGFYVLRIHSDAGMATKKILVN